MKEPRNSTQDMQQAIATFAGRLVADMLMHANAQKDPSNKARVLAKREAVMCLVSFEGLDPAEQANAENAFRRVDFDTAILFGVQRKHTVCYLGVFLESLTTDPRSLMAAEWKVLTGALKRFAERYGKADVVFNSEFAVRNIETLVGEVDALQFICREPAVNMSRPMLAAMLEHFREQTQRRFISRMDTVDITNDSVFVQSRNQIKRLLIRRAAFVGCISTMLPLLVEQGRAAGGRPV